MPNVKIELSPEEIILLQLSISSSLADIHKRMTPETFRLFFNQANAYVNLSIKLSLISFNYEESS